MYFDPEIKEGSTFGGAWGEKAYPMFDTADGKITSVFWRGHLLVKLWDSRHIQLSTCTAFDEESELHNKNSKFQRPDTKK